MHHTYLIPIIYVSLILFIIILSFILLYVYNKSYQENKKVKWLPTISLLVQSAIFMEDEDNQNLINIPPPIIKLLKKYRFRNYLIDELVKAKLNFTGNSGLNIVMLYQQLNLFKDSNAKLASPKCHLKAKGIQELALFNHQYGAPKIFELTNHENQLIRSEAQCALIDFYGFEGLSFLDTTTFTITEWQQIQLLNKLSHIFPEDFSAIGKWLQCNDESVVVFALKLASHYKCYDLHAEVVKCLNHSSSAVNIQAVKCLQQIYLEGTSSNLLDHYNNRNKQYQVLILESLQGYNQERETEFLLQQLTDQDNDIKMAAAKSLAFCMPGGRDIISSHPLAGKEPLKKMILQFKNE
jgi:hypothetical protein